MRACPAVPAFITAIVRGEFVKHLHKAVADGVLRRFTLGAPCDYCYDGNLPTAQVPGMPSSVQHVLGIIDDGCCLAHEAFRNRDCTADEPFTNKSRILAVWDQEPSLQTNTEQACWTNAPHAYGLELIHDQIDLALAENPALGEAAERKLYGDIGRPRWGSPDHTHGARVMHLLAGPIAGQPPASGTAGAMPVVFVQLPLQTVEDTSGDSLGVHVVDGARYIVARTREAAGADAYTTINISLGSIAGPHDGSSMAEMALSDLVKHSEIKGARPPKRRVSVVVAAGNTADNRRVHGVRSVGRGTPGHFLVRVPPDCERDSFVEFWLPGDAPDCFTVEVSAPTGECSVIRVGELASLKGHRGKAIAGVVFARKVAQGLNGTMVLLAIGPTAQTNGPRARRSLAPAGLWEVRVHANVPKKTDVHAWIERDDIIIGEREPQQTRFEHDNSTNREVSYITNDHTLASLANGDDVVVVGGYVERPRIEAPYSGKGPLRSKAGAKANPDRPNWFAPSDRSPSLRGMAVPGFFSGSHAAISGTSAAAPQVARTLAESQQRVRSSGNGVSHKPPPMAGNFLRRSADGPGLAPPTASIVVRTGDD